MQRRTNYALRPMPREEFVRLISADLSAPPPYFARAAALNRRGARALEEIEMRALTPAECAADSQPVLFLDVRSSDAFAAGHVPGAINIGLDVLRFLKPWRLVRLFAPGRVVVARRT